MSETSATAAMRTGVPLALTRGASIVLLALTAGCASTAPPPPTGEPRRVMGCRFEPVHYEEVYRCSPNPATPGRLLCGYRDERIPDRWWLEYETGDPRAVDEETCGVEGELRRWECQSAEGYVYLDQPPASCL